jgi:hypothetical protein
MVLFAGVTGAVSSFFSVGRRRVRIFGAGTDRHGLFSPPITRDSGGSLKAVPFFSLGGLHHPHGLWCGPLHGCHGRRPGARRRRRVRRRDGTAGVGVARGVHPEHRYGRFQIVRLRLERAGGGRRLFDQRSVLLRDFVHLRDGLVALADALALFL